MKVKLISSNLANEINTTRLAPQLSILSLAALLREHGHSPEVLDLSPYFPDPEDDQLQYFYGIVNDFIGKNGEMLLSLSCFATYHFPFMRQLAQMVKSEYPKMPIAIGGMHVTLFPVQIMEHCPEFDFLAIGEGEEQMLAIANYLSSGDRLNLENCQALVYRNENDVVVKNERKDYIKNIDTLPMPAWDLVDFEKYHQDHSAWHNPKGHDIKVPIPILTSRSCPFACNFCGALNGWGRGLRKRSAVSVVDEIQFLNDTYGHQYFSITDDNISIDKKHIMSFINEIKKRNLDIQFEATNGLYLASLDEEVVSGLAEIGLCFCCVPIEHGNDWMRNKIIGKKLSREKIFEVTSLYKKYQIRAYGAFIIGFPEDTPETLNDSLDMIQQLDLSLDMTGNLMPFPGTQVYEQAIKDKLFVKEFNAEDVWSGQFLSLYTRQDFYIKPYNMELEELKEYRQKFDEITNRKLTILRNS